MSIEFIITSLIVIFLPGTGVIYTIAIGLGRGFKPSVAAAFGCTIGILPAALASIVGLAAIFHTSALAFQVMKYLGVIYLIYMAWNMMREGGALDVTNNQEPTSLAKTALNGVLINILNPKLSFFFLAFLPQFVDVNQTNATQTMLLLAGIFMGLTFIVFIGYGAFATLAHKYVIRRPAILKWAKRLFAGTFGFLGLRLALTEK